MTPTETLMLSIVKTYDGPDEAILQIEPPREANMWFVRLVVIEARRDYVVASGRATTLDDAVGSLARLRGIALPAETPKINECGLCGGTGQECNTCEACHGSGST
jgi:hypothetical protein